MTFGDKSETQICDGLTDKLKHFYNDCTCTDHSMTSSAADTIQSKRPKENQHLAVTACFECWKTGLQLIKELLLAQIEDTCR